jgi:DUF4097 and DUF4098 domain-containing protein YvlB
MRRIITTLVIALMASVAQAASEDVIRKSFNVGSGGTLTLDASRGGIKIVTGGTGVAIEVVRSVRFGGDDDSIREHQVDFRQNGNDVSITGRHPQSRDWFNFGGDRLRVQWNIRVPHNYSVDVKTSGGKIEITDVRGKVHARTSGGSISAGRIDGPVRVHTSGGSVSIDGATGPVKASTSGGSISIGDAKNEVDVNTSGGSITIDRVSGDVKAHTSGGGIRITETSGKVDATTSGGSITAKFARQPGGDSRLSTSGGSVNVALASNIAATIDARTSGGGVDSDLPVTVSGKIERGSLNGTINGGGPRLVLRSSGGGINLSRL